MRLLGLAACNQALGLRMTFPGRIARLAPAPRVGSRFAWQRRAVGGDSKRPTTETQTTTQLAPIEVETLARASALGTTESEPIDDERGTIEMVALVAIDDEEPPPDPAKLARGSEEMAPRTERLVHLRRRRESLAVTQIVAKKRTDE